jgi:hypothetical protein
MAAGGWNKGIKNSTGSAFIGKHHSEETIEKLKNRPKEIYKKPQAIEYNGDELCEYGCNQKAKYKFKAGKLCCSMSHNSCPKKRSNFAELDCTERTQKSLATRIKSGVVKSCQIVGAATRKKNGHYEKLAKKMQEHWIANPHNNLGPRGEWEIYKETKIPYQCSYEYCFLEKLENEHGIDWIISNVARGPAIWYIDPKTLKKRLYISDYIIYNTIYEIKSSYTWNRKGKDLDLENLNRAKLNECIAQGFSVILVLDKKEIEYASTLVGTVQAENH